MADDYLTLNQGETSEAESNIKTIVEDVTQAIDKLNKIAQRNEEEKLIDTEWYRTFVNEWSGVYTAQVPEMLRTMNSNAELLMKTDEAVSYYSKNGAGA